MIWITPRADSWPPHLLPRDCAKTRRASSDRWFPIVSPNPLLRLGFYVVSPERPTRRPTRRQPIRSRGKAADSYQTRGRFRDFVRNDKATTRTTIFQTAARRRGSLLSRPP